MANEKLEALSGYMQLEPGRLVMDPAMLRILPVEKIRNIAVIAMKAQISAQQEIIKELESMKI